MARAEEPAPGDVETAVRRLQRRDLDAARLYMQAWLALTYLHLGRWSEAAEDFRKAATIDPANPIYLNNFGYAQLKQDYRGADLTPVVSELQRAHELDPGSNLIRNNLALALAQAGRTAELKALLDTIPAADHRDRVAEFSAAWKPDWNNETDTKGQTP